MTVLFGRRLSLVVGDSPIAEGLRVRFDVKMTMKHNTRAKIVVTNLNATNRKALQSAVPTTVTLLAGYGADLERIFSGEITRCWSARDGADWETHLETEDGADAKTKTISKTLGPTTKKDSVLSLQAALAEAKIRPGNLLAMISKAPHGADLMRKVVHHGTLFDVLAKSLAAMGLQYRIDGGELQVCKINGVLSDTVALISPATGMIGSPEIGKHFVKVKTLITRNLTPQRLVKIESAQINGLMRVEKATYKGDTRGRDWHAELELSDGPKAETENDADDGEPDDSGDGGEE